MGGKSADRIGNIFILALGVSLVVTVVFSVMAAFERSSRQADHELARIGLEDVARRVEHGARNLKAIRELSDAVALSRARTLAELIAENPKVLEEASRAKFESYAELLGVDELHVTDEKGILRRTLPKIYEGQDMASSAQSAEFLPALTNAAFELVQEPQIKGLATGDGGRDTLVFQYAGVSRIDRPGIVQIGYRASRVAEAMKFADIGLIASTTRIGRRGRVRITPLVPGERPAPGLRQERDVSGQIWSVFETECAGYRVSVAMPESRSPLRGEDTFAVLVVLDLVLLFLFILAFPPARARIVRDLRAISSELAMKGAQRLTFARAFFSPLSISLFVFFLILLAVIFFSARRSALREAREQLAAAAADMIDDLDACVDAQLAFIGRELCDAYETPQALATADFSDLMETYFVDEINVVDARGICIASTVPEIKGDDEWKKVNPSKFCQALLTDGRDIFSQPFRRSASEAEVYRKYVGIAFRPPTKGFVQIGFDRSRLQSSMDYRIRDLAHSWHIGERGFFVVSKTSNGEILSTRDESLDGETLAALDFDVFTARMKQNVERRDPVSNEFLGFAKVNFFETKFNGEKCLCTTGVVNQFHRYTALIPLDEVYVTAWTIFCVTAAVLLIAFVAVALFWTKLSSLVTSLRGYIAREKANVEKDLSVARTIQLSSLPPSFPDLPEWRLFAEMDTAREVGGDFFDFSVMPSGRIFFMIADVSGKGIPAAMFMMKAKTTVRACLYESKSLSEAVVEANNRLSENNDANMFVTAWFGLFDLKTGELEYVNAGHNPPLIKRADGSVEWIRGRRGFVLSAMGSLDYVAERIRVDPGDAIFLYTDGVTEAQDENGGFYGEARLESALKASGEHFIQDIRRDLDAFVGEADQADDITMLAFHYKKQV